MRCCHNQHLLHGCREQAAGRNAVWLQCSSSCIAACAPQVHSVTCFELPVYYPSAAEKADPKLYAANVRKLMVSESRRKGAC